MNKYNDNYRMLVEIVKEILTNYKDFVIFCDYEGIKALPDTEEDLDNTYMGIAKLLNNKKEEIEHKL